MGKKDFKYVFEIDGNKLPFSGPRAAALELYKSGETDPDVVAQKIEDLFGTYNKQGATLGGMVRRVKTLYDKIKAADVADSVEEFAEASWNGEVKAAAKRPKKEDKPKKPAKAPKKESKPKKESPPPEEEEPAPAEAEPVEEEVDLSVEPKERVSHIDVGAMRKAKLKAAEAAAATAERRARRKARPEAAHA